MLVVMSLCNWKADLGSVTAEVQPGNGVPKGLTVLRTSVFPFIKSCWYNKSWLANMFKGLLALGPA